MLANTFSFIFYTWTITLVLQLLGVTWILPLKSNRFIDKGWALGRIISWLAIALVIWFLAFLKIPINTNFGLWFLLIIFIGLSAYKMVTQKQLIKKSITTIKPFIIVEEALFALGLAFLTITRSFNPHIQDLEKPMDAGFMASYLRAPTLPAPDMWLSGESINYYSFGHYLGSIMSRIWHLEVTFSYNLLLALILGLSLTLSFSIAVNLIHFSKHKSRFTFPTIIGGLVASFLVSVGGNTHTIWYFITNKSWVGYWYADATRFIHNTIHEFPSYSFVVADIHAHVWNFPLVLTFIFVTIHWVRSLFHPLPRSNQTKSKSNKFTLTTLKKYLHHHQHYLIPSLILGLLVGIFAMTSAWDAMIYPIFLAILGIIIIIYDYRQTLPLIYSAIVVTLTAALTALPWYLNFTSISEGVVFVTQRSPLWQFLALWSGHLLITFMALIVVIIILAISKSRSQKVGALFIMAMIFTAWILLLLPEIIYFKDIYTGHPRANTMFKLTYQAFIFMGLIGGWLMGTVLITKHIHNLFKAVIVLLIITITASFATFPYFAYRGYYGNYQNFQGINGYQWLKDKYPSDFSAIYWMQQNISGQPTILEAVGESYTDYARVSAYTGMPAVLGWRVHEWLWRGGFDIPGQRTEEVKTMYLHPLSAEAAKYLDTYQVEYIFVGDKEYDTYKELDVGQLMKLGDVIYSQGRTFIIHRTRS